jgi:hypothetical protein
MPRDVRAALSESAYEMLGVPRDVPRPQLARAWRARKAEAAAVADRLEGDGEALMARLDAAFALLLDPARRALYDAYVAQDRAGTPKLRPAAEIEPLLAVAPSGRPGAAPWDVAPRTTEPGAPLPRAEEVVVDESPPRSIEALRAEAARRRRATTPSSEPPKRPGPNRAPWDRD